MVHAICSFLLEDYVDMLIGPHKALVFDNTGMRQALQQVHLLLKLDYFVLCFASKFDSLDSNYATC